MASPLVIGAAIGAGYLALMARKSAAAPASTPEATASPEQAPNVGAHELTTAVSVAAAAEAPGSYIDPAGAHVKSDGMVAVNTEVVEDGSTSCTPSSEIVGGSTSVTPSGGAAYVPAIGSTMEYADGSPTGPQLTAPTITEAQIPVSVRYGGSSGLTTKQVSAALESEGPALGMVW